MSEVGFLITIYSNTIREWCKQQNLEKLQNGGSEKLMAQTLKGDKYLKDLYIQVDAHKKIHKLFSRIADYDLDKSDARDIFINMTRNILTHLSRPDAMRLILSADGQSVEQMIREAVNANIQKYLMESSDTSSESGSSSDDTSSESGSESGSDDSDESDSESGSGSDDTSSDSGSDSDDSSSESGSDSDDSESSEEEPKPTKPTKASAKAAAKPQPKKQPAKNIKGGKNIESDSSESSDSTSDSDSDSDSSTGSSISIELDSSDDD
jgi:hypothetical protein